MSQRRFFPQTKSMFLQECKLLLASLVLITVLPSWPEFLIRSTVSSFGSSFCILTTLNLYYGLYYAFKLILQHILPAVLIFVCLLRPHTVVAKRISLIFMGESSACECGPSGSDLVSRRQISI